MPDSADPVIAAALQCEMFLKNIESIREQMCLLLIKLEEADVISGDQDDRDAWQDVFALIVRNILSDPCSGLRQPSFEHIPSWALEALRSKGIVEADRKRSNEKPEP